MKITVLKNDKKTGKSSFLLEKVTPAFANTLRRAMIELVPVMAIETLELRKNSSILYDEIVAHRLGLVPLKTDLKSYNLPGECKCKGEGCAKCSLSLTLSSKGPCTVYASDLKSKDPKVKPIYPKTPIVKLLKGQQLEFVATAILGLGREHVKWSPGLVSYVKEPIITIKNNAEKLKEFKDKYPPQIFDKSGNIDKNVFDNPNLVDACDGVCDDLIKIERKPDSFIFYVESWGQLELKEIVTAAIEALEAKNDDFIDKLKTLN